jgi:hypothetical protein
MEKSSIVYSFLVSALNLPILKNPTRKYTQDRSKLVATLLSVAITSVKRSTPSFSRFASPHGRLSRQLSPSSPVSRSYDAMTSLYHQFPQPYSRRHDRVGWPCWAPCWIHQITNWVNWPLQPRIDYKMEPFTQEPPIRKLHFHQSSTVSLFLFFF